MLFAKPTLTSEDVQDAIFKFNTSTPAAEYTSSQPTMGSSLSIEQIALVKECIERNRLLKEPHLTNTLLYDWFSCKPGTRLQYDYLSGLVELLETLEDESYIGYDWQSIIEHNQMLLTKDNGTPIANGLLSPALNQAHKSKSARMLEVRKSIGLLCKELRKLPKIGIYPDLS